MGLSAGLSRANLTLSDGFLADGQERDLCSLFGLGNALGARVQLRLSINVKHVLVMAMAELKLHHPSTIWLTLHRIGIGFPAIEVADDRDLLSARCVADKIDGP